MTERERAQYLNWSAVCQYVLRPSSQRLQGDNTFGAVYVTGRLPALESKHSLEKHIYTYVDLHNTYLKNFLYLHFIYFISFHKIGSR